MRLSAFIIQRLSTVHVCRHVHVVMLVAYGFEVLTIHENSYCSLLDCDDA